MMETPDTILGRLMSTYFVLFIPVAALIIAVMIIMQFLYGTPLNLNILGLWFVPMLIMGAVYMVARICYSLFEIWEGVI